MSGTAFADQTVTIAKKITGKKIKKGTIRSKHIKKNAVRSKHVKNGSLRAKDFKEGELKKGSKGNPAQVTGCRISVKTRVSTFLHPPTDTT